MAKAIEKAIDALEYKGATYTKVDAAIAKAKALNKDNYKDFSGVEVAVKAVVRGRNITEQSEVDKMAKAIEEAIAALEKSCQYPNLQNIRTPSTGDTSNLRLWIALLFISGGVAIGTTVVSRRKSTTELNSVPLLHLSARQKRLEYVLFVTRKPQTAGF